DIDFSKGIIHITQSKTGKVITIPLSGYLIDELMQHKGMNNGERLFEDAGITHSVVSSYSAYFSNLFKSMGIHGFTFHNLRHTFSSLLQSELGVGAVVVQGMTGHSSLSMLQKYSHSGLDSRQRAIQALTDHVLNADKNTSKVIGL
ncbi:MAG: site-specific integrase, partial [Candidatus Jettenia caeni]|nr:site-specific integrase [Candidatus Jettenia caeni]